MQIFYYRSGYRNYPRSRGGGGGPPPARALTFDVTYDLSILLSAPAGFQTAFQDAINLYQTTYIDQITINIDVGWREIDGNPLKPGNLG